LSYEIEECGGFTSLMFISDTDKRKQMYMNWNEKDKNPENLKITHSRTILQISVSLFLTKTKMDVTKLMQKWLASSPSI
jgi:hypothetical protein